MSFRITTARLLLEDLTEKDLPDVRQISANRDVMKYVLIWLENDEQVKEYVRHAIEEASSPARRDYILSVRAGRTGRFAGIVFIEIDPDHPSTAEVGCILLPEFQRKGYAPEALRALLGFGFDLLGLHRVYGKCDELNVPSCRVLERGGLAYEGTIREHVWLRDHWRSTRYYGMLAEEYHLHRDRAGRKEQMKAGRS